MVVVVVGGGGCWWLVMVVGDLKIGKTNFLCFFFLVSSDNNKNTKVTTKVDFFLQF